jgi:hypothetical protein
MYRVEMARSAVVPVAAEGGASRLQVQVHGTVQLLPGSVIPRTK